MDKVTEAGLTDDELAGYEMEWEEGREIGRIKATVTLVDYIASKASKKAYAAGERKSMAQSHRLVLAYEKLRESDKKESFAAGVAEVIKNPERHNLMSNEITPEIINKMRRQYLYTHYRPEAVADILKSLGFKEREG